MARISQQRAQEQVATARVKAGETERQKILLSARESEADQAVAQAQQARSEAQSAQAQLQQAHAESQRLAALLENMQASQTPRGIVLTLDDVLFDTGKAQLKPGAERSIEQIAAFLNENPERRVQVEGFTDSQGANDYNLELSQSRADAVAMAIIQRGIDAQRVRALGYGEGFPVASNANAGSRQLNRRVEIIVSNGNAEIPGPRGRSAVKGEFFPGDFGAGLATQTQPALPGSTIARCDSSAIRPACRKCASSSRASRPPIRRC